MASQNYRVNNRIRVREVRLIDENGEQAGVVDTQVAKRRAQDAGLDLVEISPNARPPVCKIMDFGKFKYETQKKENEARKKQKTIDIERKSVRVIVADQCCCWNCLSSHTR